MGNLGKRIRTREPVPAASESVGIIDWHNTSAEDCRTTAERWAATRDLHGADWIDARVLIDDFFDGAEASALDADDKLRHYARRQPSAILTEDQARRQTPNYDSGRGSLVDDPFVFAGEPHPQWWGAS